MPDVRCPRFHMATFLYTRVPPPLCRQFSSRLCCLKPDRRWQKRNDFLAECKGKGQTSWIVRTVLNHKTPIINGNGENNPTRMLLEGLFGQNQQLEEQITEDHHPDLGLKLEAELKKQEIFLQDADKRLFSEYSELNHAKEELKQQEEQIVFASLRLERLEEEMKIANLALASRVIFLEDLKLSLNKRDSDFLAVERALSQKEDEIERMKQDLASKDQEAAIEESESRLRVTLLNEANEILERQEDELSELEREIQEKEEELEVAKVLDKSEQGKLSVAEAKLKQQTTDWLMSQEELKKLEKEISNHSDEINGTLVDFERVRTLLAEVRSELILSQQAFALSRQELEGKGRVFEKKLEELEVLRRRVESHIMTLKNAKVEVESERVKLKVTEARKKEFERELLVEKEIIVELEKELSTERSFLEQAVEDILSLKKELDDRNTELVDMENDICVKDAELVEARLEVQRLMSKHASFQSLLEKKELELSDAQKVLAVAKEEFFELNILIKNREDNVQTNYLCSEAESMVDRIVSDTHEVFEEPEKPVGNLISRREQLEKELQLTRESLKEREMEILASQRALTKKDQELKVVSRKLESKETELVKFKEEMSIGNLAIEKLELEAAQLEVEAVTNTLEKLAQMSSELVSTAARSIEADIDISTLPFYESDSSINSSMCIGESECVSEFRTEVAKLLALTEQLVIEADAGRKGS